MCIRCKMICKKKKKKKVTLWRPYSFSYFEEKKKLTWFLCQWRIGGPSVVVLSVKLQPV